MKAFKLIIILSITFGCIISCSSDDDELTGGGGEYGIFSVMDNNTTVRMDGTIRSTSLANFNALESAYPEVDRVEIVNCDGSVDDEINLLLGQKVYAKQMEIHILDNGEIASGGVDFFLAGALRSKGANTRIGVHAWSDGNMSATDFPVGDENHLLYINYYASIGLSQQEAENFYYFTINAASADSIHWMTDNEILQYTMLTE